VKLQEVEVINQGRRDLKGGGEKDEAGNLKPEGRRRRDEAGNLKPEGRRREG